MPSNPHKDTQKARKFIVDKILSSEERGGIDYQQLILSVLIKFPVSDTYPERFIKKNFLETKVYELKDGLIRRYPDE